ncbi:MAG: ferrous iron transport protein B [Prevotellaceae bacterium]|jgi:ferrous iron transport protein B|nr:ferrous iron transport protein B [Prevotellaceae bacterium]
MRLSELTTGEKCIVVRVVGRSIKANQHKNVENQKYSLLERFNRNDAFCKRIAEMGFVRGQEVEVILNAPLKDPVKYKVMGYEVSLRRREAAMIEVVRITGENADEKHAQADFHGIITENENQNLTIKKTNSINVALVGNPNSGKSSLFNCAAKRHQHVGNYGGVTVDATTSSFTQGNYRFNIVDLPGTYSLTAYTPEEIFVRRHIAEQKPDVIINVVDASNLERNLYLTTQLIDMNVRIVIALNMYDEFLAKGNSLDYVSLSKMTGIPVVPTVARTGKGIRELFDVVAKVYEEYVSADFVSPVDEKDMPIHKTAKHIHINHGKEIEDSISKIKEEIAKNTDIRKHYSTRFLSIKLLENDHETESVISSLTNADTVFRISGKESERIKTLLGEDVETAITNAKYGFITGALRKTLKENSRETSSTTKFIDNIVARKWWGFLIFVFFMGVMFCTTFLLGKFPMGWLETGVDTLGEWITTLMDDGILKDLLVKGIIKGIGSVIVFFPLILILYLFISFMEDSGYMARAAFVTDRAMRKIGLNGKSFISLLMGFGCNTTAILSSRTIESRSSRMITILVNPFFSCTARLPVYVLLISAFFPDKALPAFIVIYLTGILVAVVMAKLFRMTLFKHEETPFVIELPPYRKPTVTSIFRHMWEKASMFLRKMAGWILAVSVLIWFLGYFPQNREISDNYKNLIEQTENQYEQYKKEVNELNAAFNEKEKMSWSEFKQIWKVWGLMIEQEGLMNFYEHEKNIKHQEQSYIGRIGKFIEPAIKPLGFNWQIGIALVSGLPAKEVIVSTLGIIYAGDSDMSSEKLSQRLQADKDLNKSVAFALIIFILLYFPCISAIKTIRDETGSWKWGAFAVFYTLMLAWILSFAVYQLKIGELIF